VNAWKVILSTLVIFVAGVITGVVITATESVAITRALRRNANAPSGEKRPPSAASATPWQFRDKELLRRMDRELELTPEQHVRVDRIMSASSERTKAIWKPIAPLMNKEAQLTRAEIRELLTPEQQKKFDGFKPRSGIEKRHNSNAPPAGLTTNAVPTNSPSTP